MRLSCLVFLVVISVAAVIECKPLSDDAVTEAPCVDCEQKGLRRKRCLDLLAMLFGMPVHRNRRRNVYVGNGRYNVNHVVINSADNVYIGNGAYNTNYVSYG